ncbi:MAG: hypothetical protein ACTSU4_03575 [Promethearchaeota archaeon]
MKISAERGNKHAKAIVKSNIESIQQYLEKVLEFTSINLQAEANRICSTALGKYYTGEIGKNIRDIIEQQIENVITLLEKESINNGQLNGLIPTTLKNLAFLISKDKKALEIVNEINEMNLFHDFGKIVEKINCFEIKIIDQIFKYLILLNIQRRIERRQFLKK